MGVLSGVDIIEIERVKESIESSGEKFLKKVFTENEIAYCNKKKSARFQSFAGRFAAKEAVSKALGTGIGPLSLGEIEILNDPLGAPWVALSGKAKEIAFKKKITDITLSISHCKCHVVALAVALRENSAEGEIK